MGRYLKANPYWSHEKQMAYYRQIMRDQIVTRVIVGLGTIAFVIFVALVIAVEH